MSIHSGGRGPGHCSRLSGGSDPTRGYPLYLDFKNGVYGDGSRKTLTELPGYTYTRSGAKSELDASGSPIAFAADTPGIVPGVGYWSRASLTNLLKRSQDLTNAAWTRQGTATVTGDTGAAPDGTTTADTVNVPAVNDYVFQAVSGQAGAQDTLSMWLSGTGTINLVFYDNVSSFQFKTITLTATPTRYSFTATYGAGATDMRAGVGRFGTNTATSVSVWQAQLVAGSNPGPIIPTTTTVVTVGADSLTVNLANGTYSAVYTFDDGSTQTISTTVSGGTFTLPVNPTTLNRPLIQKVTLA